MKPKSHAGEKKPVKASVRMTPKQEYFVNRYIVHKDATRAAEEAGYASPKVAGFKLLNAELHPLVVRAVKDAAHKATEGAILDAKGVLRYIHLAMTFQPMRYFTPSEGGWLLTDLQYKELPDDVGQLIEEVKVKVSETVNTTTGETEKETFYWVTFVSKTKAMDLAAKHQLGEKLNVQHLHVNWDDLVKGVGGKGGAGSGPGPTSSLLERLDEDDPIEAEIVAEERKALPAAAPTRPS